jgi:hypothetical protein
MARMLRAGAKCALCDSPLERANVRINIISMIYVRLLLCFTLMSTIYGKVQMASGQLAHTAAKTASRLNRQTKEMGISQILDRLESEKLPEYVPTSSMVVVSNLPNMSY